MPTDTGSFLALLDTADRAPGAVALRARGYELLRLAPGAPVVDVGCGTGRAVQELAEHGARPVGVDRSQEMITVARHRWPDLDLRVGDACALPLADGEVHGYRADKVFHDLADPVPALREARRVLAPGGRIVLAGQDWDTLVIDSDDPALTRTIVHARADTLPNPRAARRYRTLLLDTGFTDLTVEVHTGVFTDGAMLPMLAMVADAAHSAGAITRTQTDKWLSEQTERATAGRLFLAIPVFVAAARC